MQDWKTDIQTAFSPRALDADVLDELSQHAESTYAACRADGLHEAAARDYVRAEIRAWVAQAPALGRRPRDGVDVEVQTGSQVVSAGYFSALGQRVLSRDANSRSPIPRHPSLSLLVNREFSRRYLKDRALGWTLPASERKRAPRLLVWWKTRRGRA